MVALKVAERDTDSRALARKQLPLKALSSMSSTVFPYSKRLDGLRKVTLMVGTQYNSYRLGSSLAREGNGEGKLTFIYVPHPVLGILFIC